MSISWRWQRGRPPKKAHSEQPRTKAIADLLNSDSVTLFFLPISPAKCPAAWQKASAASAIEESVVDLANTPACSGSSWFPIRRSTSTDFLTSEALVFLSSFLGCLRLFPNSCRTNAQHMVRLQVSPVSQYRDHASVGNTETEQSLASGDHRSVINIELMPFRTSCCLSSSDIQTILPMVSTPSPDPLAMTSSPRTQLCNSSNGTHFVIILQLISNYRLIRLKILISYKIVILCN